MITTINANNRDKYVVLFDEAIQLLAEQSPDKLQKEFIAVADAEIYWEAGLYWIEDSSVVTSTSGDGVRHQAIAVGERAYYARPGYYYKEISGEYVRQGSEEAGYADSEKFDKNAIYYVRYVKDPGTAYDAEVVYYEEKIKSFESLEEFFCMYKDITKLDSKFYLLPLDEEYFEVNANTRTINVPAHFRKNGISVQGDEVAEIIVFRINRFFDYMDLDTCDVYVQWEAAKKGTAAAPTYLTPIRLKEYDGEEYLLLGWPISSKLTANAGSIKFSLRFVKTNGKEITYSWSSLTANAAINAALDFDIQGLTEEGLIDETDKLFLNNIENSQAVSVPQPATPVFIISVADLVDETDKNLYLNENGELELAVLCSVADAGTLTYEWFFTTEPVGDKKLGITYNLSTSPDNIEFRAVTNTEYNPGGVKHNYYIKDENSSAHFNYNYTTAEQFAADVEAGKVYEQWTVYTIKAGQEGWSGGEKGLTLNTDGEAVVVGEYWVVPTNSINSASTSIASINLPVVAMPGPGEISFTKDLYSADETDEALKAYPVLKDNKANLAIEIADKEKATESYVWKRADALPTDEEAAAAIEAYDETDVGALTVEETGYYWVEATSTLNLDTETIISRAVKVTNDPVAPVIEEDESDINEANKVVYFIDDEMKVNIAIPEYEGEFQCEAIDFIWYLETADDLTDKPVQIPAEAAATLYSKTSNLIPNDEGKIQVSILKEWFKNIGEGTYRFGAVNKLNNRTTNPASCYSATIIIPNAI